jgi:Flp pilus assembly protein TadG
MRRLACRLRALSRRLAEDRKGATAIEFALISIPMMMLMLGVIELGLILLVSVTLETATEFTARDIRTGVFQMSGANSKNDYKAKVCRNMSWLSGMCTTKLYVETQTFDTFNSAGASAPAEPSAFDPTKTCWSPGNPEDIVLVRTYFEWPIITPLLKPVFTDYGSGARLLSSARLFRNEPFNPSLKKAGAKC